MKLMQHRRMERSVLRLPDHVSIMHVIVLVLSLVRNSENGTGSRVYCDAAFIPHNCNVYSSSASASSTSLLKQVKVVNHQHQRSTSTSNNMHHLCLKNVQQTAAVGTRIGIGIGQQQSKRKVMLYSELQDNQQRPKYNQLKRILVKASQLFSHYFNYRRFLWPGSLPDKAYKEPLIPGELGCPFFGVAMKAYSPFEIKKKSDKEKEEEEKEQYRKNKIFDALTLKFRYAFLSPMVFISGKRNVRKVLNSEFKDGGVAMTTFAPNERKLFGGHSILYAKDKQEHGFTRRLVGNAMTPSSISKAIPQLQNTATKYVNEMITPPTSTSTSISSSSSSSSSEEVIGENIFQKFTIDVAGTLILGLKLTKEEEITFKTQMDIWLNGLLSFETLFLPFGLLRFTKAWKARLYLISMIENKIQALRDDGPDESTLSAMVFATDDEKGSDNVSTSSANDKHTKRSLSHEQIIDNVLFLMLAGSETSSSTLTNCLLFLGLHPTVWKKVVKEQKELCNNHGEVLTKDQLDNDCPYLEAVIKETMRLRPISGGQFRRTKETMIIDGQQVPKGWPIVYNIRRTHEDDPMTKLDDGSHMDLINGFKPERWLDEETRPKDGDYIPFGSGPRFCLGYNLAMAEMKLFLATMARNLDFDLVGVNADNVDDIQWKRSDLIAVPSDGVAISVRPK